MDQADEVFARYLSDYKTLKKCLDMLTAHDVFFIFLAYHTWRINNCVIDIEQINLMMIGTADIDMENMIMRFKVL
jgi:hypothetical protein